MIVVTGAAGFIGSRLIQALNAKGITDIVAVDDLTDGRKCVNLAGRMISDYINKSDFTDSILAKPKFWKKLQAVFHQGACSATTEWDGKFMMQNNYDYSKILLHHCAKYKIPFIYASSAAVYGVQKIYRESVSFENPINMYAYSKWQFDQYLRQRFGGIKSQVAGLRYFNVYGPNEQHKMSMASVAYHFYQQMQSGNTVRLFEGSDGYGNGEQRRDFIYVDDVVAVNLWLLENPGVSGIYNVGTGQSRSFKDVANAVLKWFGRGEIEYIPFPEHLKGHYQSFTEADMTALREAGYSADFHSVEAGVSAYLDVLSARHSEA